jgi:hypothetical protein
MLFELVEWVSIEELLTFEQFGVNGKELQSMQLVS